VRFQQIPSRPKAMKARRVDYLDRISGGKPHQTFPECGLTDFEADISRVTL
jgi:hypothetical protein